MRIRIAAVLAFTGALTIGSAMPANAYTTDGLQFYVDSLKADSYDASDPSHWNDISSAQISGDFANVVPDSTTGAMKFVGNGCSGSYVDFGSTNLDYSNGVTIEFVADLGAADAYERIIDFGDGMETNNLIVSRYDTSDNLMFEVWHSGSHYSRFLTWNDPLATSGPLHFAVTIDADRNAHWYVNGEAVLTNINGSITTDGQVYEGLPPVEARAHSYVGRSHWCDPGLDGQIEYIRIYGRGLTAAEVLDNYTYDDSTLDERTRAASSGLASTGFDPAGVFIVGLGIVGVGAITRRRRTH